jgi:hypothetical protein
MIGIGTMPLRLRAEDAEDLAVISACLQDALIVVRDLAYDPGARLFMLVANRFRWENCRPGLGRDAASEARFERTLCGVAFANVGAVAYRGFRRDEKDRILCLLAVRAAADAAGVAIDLDFAGRAGIRMTASVLRVRARDFGDPWPTRWRPGHEPPTHAGGELNETG